MQILQRLKTFFEPIEPIKLNDLLFGVIRFQNSGFWEGYTHFAPLDQQIEVLIDGGKEGPTEKQRQFYREVESKYDDMTPELGDLLQETFSRRKSERNPDVRREDVWKEFKLEGINIPSCDIPSPEWELSYFCASNGHNFDVQMKGWEVEGLEMNG